MTTADATDLTDPTDAADPTDPLAAEQAYLVRARADLALMRSRTLALDVQGGNAVSTEYLAATLWRRARSLVDDPSAALFFGRTDHDDGARWYIGRRHVADPDGDPVVVDWRADVSRAFYRASRAEPLGVVRRRRFGVDQGRLTAYEDEHLTDPAEAEGRSEILAHEIERPRVGPMRDIVATIQPEQDQIVRADVGTTVCVQGAPGTGKTAVGLHRAAWLLYAYRERLGRSGVLVVGPSASFLEHVGAVLPSLGEVDVRHTTIEALTGQVRVRGRDDVRAATIKGDARMAQVVRRAVWSHVRPPTEALVLPRGSHRWRIPAHEAAEIVEELRSRGARYAAARDMLPQRLAHALLLQFEAAGDSPDDRVQDAVARSREVRRWVDAVWPTVTPQQVLFRLLADAGFLAGCADGVLEADEQAALQWATPSRTPGAARWSSADAVLVDEIGDVLRRTPSLGHVVLDEAQDHSPMQLRAVGRRCSTGSATVLGDIAQGTTPWATPSWDVTLTHLGRADAVLEVLDRGFRVPAAVIAYAARLLPFTAPGMAAPTSVRDDPGSLEVTRVPRGGLWTATVDAVRTALAAEGSVGVIVPDSDVRRCATALTRAGVEHHVLGEGPQPAVPAGDPAGDPTGDPTGDPGQARPPLPPRVSVVPATAAKGLEYDRVVVVEPAAIAAAEPDERTGLRRLYVVLTRAVSGLAVLHTQPLPGPLAD
ncbi:MAG: HelD family protein [Kineosporiaceae bacterium]